MEEPRRDGRRAARELLEHSGRTGFARQGLAGAPQPLRRAAGRSTAHPPPTPSRWTAKSGGSAAPEAHAAATEEPRAAHPYRLTALHPAF
eukprot:8065861-Pyramimonas_sp.AAC.1